MCPCCSQLGLQALNAEAAQLAMRFIPAFLRVGWPRLSRLCCSHEGSSEAGAETQGLKLLWGRTCLHVRVLVAPMLLTARAQARGVRCNTRR